MNVRLILNLFGALRAKRALRRISMAKRSHGMSAVKTVSAHL